MATVQVIITLAAAVMILGGIVKMELLRAYCGLNSCNGDDGRSTDREAILVELCDKFFPTGCTTIDAVGLWKGYNQERTVIIEIITDRPDVDYIKLSEVAGRYKELAQQETVLITRQPIQAELI